MATDFKAWNVFKNATMERLKADGRWDGAVAFREQKKGEGMCAADAWRAMAEAFPAPGGSVSEVSRVDLGSSGIRVSRDGSDVSREVTGSWPDSIDWVADRIGDSADVEVVAPSARAANLLAWARGHQSEFYTTFVARRLPKEVIDGKEAENGDDSRLAELESRLIAHRSSDDSVQPVRSEGASGESVVSEVVEGGVPEGPGVSVGGMVGMS